MARRLVAALAFGLVGALALAHAASGAAAQTLGQGSRAPAFAGTNFDGSEVTLVSASGAKGLVLWFFPKAGTGG